MRPLPALVMCPSWSWRFSPALRSLGITPRYASSSCAVSQLPAPHPAMEFSIGASVGVAQLEPLEDAEQWKARADKALYKAKQNGRDRVAVAFGVLARALTHRVALGQQMLTR